MIVVEEGKEAEKGESDLVRIAWKVKATGAEGHGDWINRDTAKAWLAEERSKHSGDMEHWLEEEKDQKEQVEK